MKNFSRFCSDFSIVSFTAGLVLGGAFTPLWFVGDRFMPLLNPPESTLTAPTVTTLTSESGAIAVSDQAAGGTVKIDSVTVPPPGVWVAVRETGDGNDLGNVLGALRVRGPLSNLSIDLLRPTEAGRVYAVELYRADTDGNFDPASDSVYVDFDTGERVVALFKTK